MPKNESHTTPRISQPKQEVPSSVSDRMRRILPLYPLFLPTYFSLVRTHTKCLTFVRQQGVFQADVFQRFFVGRVI